MRIIAGEFRGRKLLPPATDTTRPVTDRVKQSIFDILSPLIPDAAIYDCFAGTGSMGLECLSRGAARATFFEADRSAIARLRKNIEAVRVEKRSTVIPGDIFRWFSDPTTTGKASLIFLDPPYRFLRERSDDLRTCALNAAARHIAPVATLVFRHDTSDALGLPPWTSVDIRTYGKMTVEFLQLPSPPNE